MKYVIHSFVLKGIVQRFGKNSLIGYLEEDRYHFYANKYKNSSQQGVSSFINTLCFCVLLNNNK